MQRVNPWERFRGNTSAINEFTKLVENVNNIIEATETSVRFNVNSSPTPPTQTDSISNYNSHQRKPR